MAVKMKLVPYEWRAVQDDQKKVTTAVPESEERATAEGLDAAMRELLSGGEGQTAPDDVTFKKFTQLLRKAIHHRQHLKESSSFFSKPRTGQNSGTPTDRGPAPAGPSAAAVAPPTPPPSPERAREEGAPGASLLETLKAAVPASARNRAESLLNYVKTRPDLIDWDPNTRQLKLRGGPPMPGTDVVALIADFSKPKRAFQATGWREALDVLRQMNVPPRLIGGKERKRLFVTPSTSSAAGAPVAKKKTKTKKTSIEATATKKRWVPNY